MLELKDVSFWYNQSEPPVVYRCGFAVPDRNFTAIVGRSGGGKTTLLRLACGLLQQQVSEQPEQGYRLQNGVKYNGAAIARPHPEFAYVPQHFQKSLYPKRTARGNILMAVSEDRESPEEQAFAEKLMRDTGIIEVADLNVFRLSGGQQQRVAICRALITQPKVLFMDEPFANLDPTLCPKMNVLLNNLEEAYDLSLVFVTHDYEEAAKLADQIIGAKQSYGLPEYTCWPTAGREPQEISKEIEEWLCS